MKDLAILVFRILDILLLPFTIISSIWMKGIRTANMRNMPVSKKIFEIIGVLPLRDQYSDPLINPKKHLTKSLQENRNLTGINLNEKGQLDLLKQLNYNEELLSFPYQDTKNQLVYHYDNYFFPAGDGEYLYNIIRHFKPGRIIEVGCGKSTLMIFNALKNNRNENSQYSCQHICVEPYNQPWLEQTSAEIIRKKIEDVELDFFKSLKANDILFIDSSHVIRPQGDVLFEILTILPVLQTGVIVHIHDIYTPRDYLDVFIYDEMRLWNEQYMVEAFLTNNDTYEIIGALNWLKHQHASAFYEKHPVIKEYKNLEPSSFWLRKK